ncbi:MlaA family lipoprotein [Cupriavidus taiwanensis]|uniref:LIPOPROTEIN VACJ-like n=1 Tax=Cupriavidus taiwanensis TaxID=164546 RepID=A0A7Z7J6P7_9BURK|nr:VacJ family lipoprotein [Cupriavidus taiwanensis]SOY89726.1 LIPOPROTEIN PRECURSOR VACJ-like [Cupriavidus taiwanensis]SOZ03476.1 LIPOPROTEIN PRECURSOR VACJ-like [Cupriavidus taiwanensis]SOZ09089.1 LIPOPROTEIN PRECURSOR VACJ-like [Cupriavidus taiwanensis]SPC07265.1 LIPOPROTEIN PRECURSOR VACJ-like [Cupriavidus taiwanensis]SPD41988.1 LIPOPROTEIN VACJ-like [Cupriavidus taiwanensis]
MNAARPIRNLLATAAAAAALAGCATGPTANPKDPLEPFNREVSKINEDFDKGILRPVAELYADYMPTPVQRAVENFFSNVSDVYSAVNNLLQGKPTRAAEDTMRVAMNTVLGIGGLIDIATPAGLPKYKEDFGQTLGVWGVPAGPYLVLPLFGPSTFRDTAGMLVDRQADPSAYFYPVSLRNSLVGVRIVAGRAQLLGASSLLEQAALDKYSFLRDSYLQRRQYLIYDGNPPVSDDEAEAEGAAPAPAATDASAVPAPAPTPAPSADGASAPAAEPPKPGAAGETQPEGQSMPLPPVLPGMPGVRFR